MHSHNNTEEYEFEFDDYTQRVIVATVLLVISLTGIVGNVMVGIAVLVSTKLRTTTNAFVVNLSIADLLTCLVIPWNSIALLSRDGLIFGESVCSVVAVVLFTTVGCSIYNLGSISLNRLLLITRPTTTYRKIFTPQKIAVWLLLTWLIPLLVSLVPTLGGIGSLGYNKQYYFCGSLPSNQHYFTYNVIIGLGFYPVPLLAIFTSYPLIWMHLRRHAKRLTTTPRTQDIALTVPNTNQGFTIDSRAPTPLGSNINLVSVGVNKTQVPSTSNTSGKSSHGVNRQNEVTKNMLYIVCGFFLCLTPYTLTLIFWADSAAIPYTTAILLLNHCINPVIYATKHRDFKIVFGCVLRRQWDRIPNPSGFLKALRRK